MKFPVSVHFNRRLKAIITVDNQEIILQYIKRFILEDKADKVVIKDMSVTYNGSTSNWTGSLFKSVDNGTFSLLYKNDSWFLSYQINMMQLFIISGIMSIGMGAFMQIGTGDWWIGMVMFLWLCGGNWVIILIRHGSVATELSVGIDELICGKEEMPEQDKMNGKLKSWF